MTKFAKRWNNGNIQEASVSLMNLVSAMSDPTLISLGGGSPAKDALPLEAIRTIADDCFRKETRGVEAFSYGPAAGSKDLREVVLKYLLEPNGIEASVDNLVITSGSLEVMNLMCQAFIKEGDVVLVESPTFVQSALIFQLFGATCIPCAMDENGLIMDEVEAKMKQYKPKLLYTIPTFQNPMGVTLTADRRKKLAELASRYDVLILEDDPYRALRYSGEDIKPVKCYDTDDHVVLAGSFSKIFSPGSRLGYAVTSKEIATKLADAKMSTNTHSPAVSQVLAAEFFKRGYYPEHLEKIRAFYKVRRDAMLAALDKYMPAGTTHTVPDGGMFVWVTLPEQIDTTELLDEAVKKIKVAFVAGNVFYVEDKGHNCLRLSFTSVSPETITDAIRMLGELVAAKL